MCRLSSSPATGTGTTSFNIVAWACQCAAITTQYTWCFQQGRALKPPRATNGHSPGNFRRKRRSFQNVGAAHTAPRAGPHVYRTVPLRSVLCLLLSERRTAAAAYRASAQHVMCHPDGVFSVHKNTDYLHSTCRPLLRRLRTIRRLGPLTPEPQKLSNVCGAGVWLEQY